MNTQLVESLIQVINSLSPGERNLLNEKLQRQSDWSKMRSRIIKRGKIISQRNQDQPLSPSVSEIIHQMREERDEQLMSACFPEREEK